MGVGYKITMSIDVPNYNCNALATLFWLAVFKLIFYQRYAFLVPKVQWLQRQIKITTLFLLHL
jgi:hypothetical protein